MDFMLYGYELGMVDCVLLPTTTSDWSGLLVVTKPTVVVVFGYRTIYFWALVFWLDAIQFWERDTMLNIWDLPFRKKKVCLQNIDELFSVRTNWNTYIGRIERDTLNRFKMGKK